MKTKQITVVTLVIECEKPVADIASHIAQRAYMVEGVSNAIAVSAANLSGLDVVQLSQAFDRLALHEHNERNLPLPGMGDAMDGPDRRAEFGPMHTSTEDIRKALNEGR